MYCQLCHDIFVDNPFLNSTFFSSPKSYVNDTWNKFNFWLVNVQENISLIILIDYFFQNLQYFSTFKGCISEDYFFPGRIKGIIWILIQIFNIYNANKPWNYKYRNFYKLEIRIF